MKDEEQNIMSLCINCFHCKVKNGKIFCKYGNFKDLTYEETTLLTPFDYECWKGIFFEE